VLKLLETLEISTELRISEYEVVSPAGMISSV
jgi:hypothetical protein